MTEMRHDTAAESCGECPLQSNRRAFLRSAALSVVATLVATGFSPGAALAELVTETKGKRLSAALRSYSLPPADAVLVDESNDVIITRFGRKVYAFSQRCPHKGARLVWHEDEDRIFCPKHKARFMKNGDHASGRSSRNLDRYAVRMQGREIVVDTDRIYREDQSPQEWESAFVGV
jgi:nitrite reductase/ring-hydroxylating ferredoxin subunit